MVFVDGLGIPAKPEHSPIAHHAPILHNLMTRHAVPLDATLGVKGLPQSATGQTSLITGINAPQLMGRHIEAFPGKELIPTIREHNILRHLATNGKSVVFANGYYFPNLPSVQNMRHQSVTTISALSYPPALRYQNDLHNNEAVAHDITRLALRPRGYHGKLISPETAAKHLITIAAKHDFTLFELFQTDQAGHRRSPRHTATVLRKLDRFLKHIIDNVPPDLGLLLTSDHGNIEDPATRTHTRNPIPCITFPANHWIAPDRLQDLTDVKPFITEHMLRSKFIPRT